MKPLFISVLLFVSYLGFAQTIKGDFDMANYPEISFVWNEYNPEVKDLTQFILSNNGIKVPFKVENLSYSDSIPKSKTILFLWEDLNHKQHAGKSEFIKTVLCDFLKDAPINTGDKFNVAVFDRKGGNDLGSSIHTVLSDKFTSDSKQLAESVQNFKPKYDFFSNQANSELYMAIEEGIEILQKEPSDRIRLIVVFTAGSNQDSYGGRNSIDENRALSLKIPVYVVKYPIKGCEHCTNIDMICQKTYGMQITTGDASIALDLLRKSYGKMNERHYGQDYRIFFTSDYPRDGKQHAFVWNVGGKEYSLSFTSPVFSLKNLIKEYPLQVVLIGVGLLLLIVLITFLISRKIKKRRKELLRLQSKQQEIQQIADANRQALEDYRQQKDNEVKAADAQKQEQYFRKQMQTKNLFPRLQYSDQGKKQVYTVIKPETSIGRDTDNDLILSSDSISRHHAKLTFNGSSFEIRDLGSTNKVIINGTFVERATLSNGDMIGLGEIVMYYCI